MVRDQLEKSTLVMKNLLDYIVLNSSKDDLCNCSTVLTVLYPLISWKVNANERRKENSIFMTLRGSQIFGMWFMSLSGGSYKKLCTREGQLVSEYEHSDKFCEVIELPEFHGC